MLIYSIGRLSDKQTKEQFQKDILETNPFYYQGTPPVARHLQKITYGRGLRDGEIGCTIAHNLIWKKFIETDQKYCMILEHDAKLIRDDFSFDYLENFLRSDEPRVLVLGISKFDVTWSRWLYWKYNASLLTVNGLKYRNMVMLNKFGTVSYSMNRNAAELFTGYDLSWIMVDDFELYRRLGVKVLFAKNFFFSEDNHISLTGNEVILQHNLKTRPLIEIAEVIFLKLRRFYKYLSGFK